MNELIQHILSKCRLPVYNPDPFLFASINMSGSAGLVVCDLDSTLSHWLVFNQCYFMDEKVTWIAFNSKGSQDVVFEIPQNFMEQKIEKESVDFQIYNNVVENYLQLEQLQKIAYCSKKNGRFVAREILCINKDDHARFLQSEVDRQFHVSDEKLHKIVIESGFSKCTISKKSYPIVFSGLNDYDKWIRQLLMLLDVDQKSFMGFTKTELEDKKFQTDFIESQEIIIRETFAVK